MRGSLARGSGLKCVLSGNVRWRSRSMASFSRSGRDEERATSAL